MELRIIGGTSVCQGAAVLGQMSESANAKQHETWESALKGTQGTRIHPT